MVDSANVYRPPRDTVVGSPDLLDFLTNPTFVGNAYYLDPTDGSDGNSGTAPDDAFATLPTAYAALEAGQHDVLYYISGSSSISLSAVLDWSKSYTHFVGIGSAPGGSPRARIFPATGATGISPMITFSGHGCVVANIAVKMDKADATSLIAVSVTGYSNEFRDCHFAGGVNATCAVDGCASLLLNGAEENMFVNCRFGVTTIPLATGGTVLQFDGSAKENIFRDCQVCVLIGNAGARLVEVIDGSGVDQINWFFNTPFISNSVNRATTMASAWEIPALTGTTALVYLDEGCKGIGFTDWDDDDRGLLFLASGTITGGGNSGIALVSAAA